MIRKIWEQNTYLCLMNTHFFSPCTLSRIKLLYLVLIAFFLWSCRQPTVHEKVSKAENAAEPLVKYATGFTIEKQVDGSYEVSVFHPDLPGQALFSCRVSHDRSLQNKAPNTAIRPIPLDSVAVFSATQLSGLLQLGLAEVVVGISDARYITDSVIKQRHEKGQITELANNGVFFTERILALNPEAVFYSPYQLNQPHPLAGSQLFMVPFMDFMETNPLGRAEWIKFTAVFFNQLPLADSLFNQIADEYNTLKKLASNAPERPTVMSDKYFADQWYVPGGKSYVATMIADAGGDYLWKNNPQVASIPLDFETVLKTASKADYWRIVSTYNTTPTYEKIGEENALYQQFDAYKNRKIIFCDSRVTGYFEKGPLEPQKQLADLIYVFHPELLPDYRPVYYQVIR